MTTVIGIRFKDGGKVYYFDPKEFNPKLGDCVIVETARGLECGIVAMEKGNVEDSAVVLPLKQIVREATDKDIAQMEKNHAKEKQAFDICVKKIQDHKLEMKLVDVEITFDNSKMLFYFTADGRIDFRELVKDLASVFRTRIELRQIGVRDESKMLGGLGVCGRPFCCSSFLGEFQPVSIKMAKDQGLSLNLAKISGTCGRLMCCLKYEQSVYDELLKMTPRQGSLVSTKEGNGIVTEVNLLKGTLKVKLDGHEEDNTAPILVSRDDVKLIRPPKPKKEDKKENAEEIPDIE